MMIISSTKNNIPVELYSLIWWILVGSEEELQTEVDYLSDPPPPSHSFSLGGSLV